MLKTWKLRRSAVVASLAVLSAWILAVTATAAPPAAEKDVPAAASPGAAAIEKAAKNNKYLFIFFFAGQDAYTGAMNGLFQTAMAKMTDRADSTAIYAADPAEKRSSTSSRSAGLPCRWSWPSRLPGPPPVLFPRSSKRPNFKRLSSAPVRPSA